MSEIKGSLDSYTLTNAKEIQKRVLHRHFTESDLYRPLSQLYDEVESKCSRKGLLGWGIALASNGFTHLLTSVITDIPDRGALTGAELTAVYSKASIILAIAGIILVVLHLALPRNVKHKETLLKRYLEQEFQEDPSISIEQSHFANNVFDGSKHAG